MEVALGMGRLSLSEESNTEDVEGWLLVGTLYVRERRF